MLQKKAIETFLQIKLNFKVNPWSDNMEWNEEKSGKVNENFHDDNKV